MSTKTNSNGTKIKLNIIEIIMRKFQIIFAIFIKIIFFFIINYDFIKKKFYKLNQVQIFDFFVNKLEAKSIIY